MENFMEQIKKNWMVLGFIIALILWYGDTNSRITAVEAKQAEQQSTLEKINQLTIDMAVVKTDVGYIKNILK